MGVQEILNGTADALVADWRERFAEAEANTVDGRSVAAAARGLLDGTLDVAAEVGRFTGATPDFSGAAAGKPILLVGSIFGVWASEVTLPAAVLMRAGRRVRLASEDGTPPHFLSPSLMPEFRDGAWRASVVSPEERDLALEFLRPGTAENALFDDVLDLRILARPPQIGDFRADPTTLDGWRCGLERTLALAMDHDGLCIAGGSGAIPGLMFDRGLHALILAFHRLGKPIMGQCNGGLALLQTLDPATGRSILAGRAVTTHSRLDEYQAGWGWTEAFAADPSSFWAEGKFDLAGYGAAERWIQPGLAGNPMIDSEAAFRAAAGPDGVFFSPPGSAYSVVADDHLVTCRTTPDGYPGSLCLLARLDGPSSQPRRLFIDADACGRPAL